MAARRLVIIMLILLGLTLIIAVTVPEPVRDAGEETATDTAPTETTPTETAPTETAPEETTPQGPADPGLAADCDLITCFRLDASAREVTVVPAAVGDQLFLSIRSKTTDLVEIPTLGLIDAVGPDNAATFDLLPDSAGSYGIRMIEADRLIGRIEVSVSGEGARGRQAQQ